MQHAHMGFLVIAEEQAKFDRGADAQRQSAIPSRIRKSPTASGRFSPNPAGKAAVLVEIEESWVSLVELRLKEKGGIVFRRFRDDQLLQAEAALEKSLERLEDALDNANAANREAIQHNMLDVKHRLRAVQEQAKAGIDLKKAEADLKMKAHKLCLRAAAIVFHWQECQEQKTDGPWQHVTTSKSPANSVKNYAELALQHGHELQVSIVASLALTSQKLRLEHISIKSFAQSTRISNDPDLGSHAAFLVPFDAEFLFRSTDATRLRPDSHFNLRLLQRGLEYLSDRG